MNKRETILYCGKKDDIYEHFYGDPIGVGMCGVSKKDIVKVNVREALPNEEPTHYAWWDNERKEFMMVYRFKQAVEICFPYGPKVEIEAGKGNIYGVMVDELAEKEGIVQDNGN